MLVGQSQSSSAVKRSAFALAGESLRASMKSGLALCSLVVLALFVSASTAQALYVEMSSAGDFDVSGQSISIDQSMTSKQMSGVGGSSWEIALAVTTVTFNDAPVMLSALDFGEDTGKAIVNSVDCVSLVYSDAAMDLMVSSITFIEIGGPSAWTTASGFDITVTTTTQAIPEPGAALLFAAGLMAASVITRRKR